MLTNLQNLIQKLLRTQFILIIEVYDIICPGLTTLGLAVTVCHYPPGASTWNPIEHRLFSPVRVTRAGIVLATVAVPVGLLRRTTTATGLKVTARVMTRDYPAGRKVTAKEFRAINLTRPETCPQWNYTIRPRPGAEKME